MSQHVIVAVNFTDVTIKLSLNGTAFDTWDPNTAPSPGKMWTTSASISFNAAYLLNGVNTGVASDYTDSQTISASLFAPGDNELDLTGLTTYHSGFGGIIIHEVADDGSIILTLFGDDNHVDDERSFANFNVVNPKVCLFTLDECTRVTTSHWVTKVCYLAGRGVRVTFKDRHGKLFTALYPGTTTADYKSLVAAASKGHWIHEFYYKKRPYVVWPISP
jgi:hypothetical protein